MKQREFFKKLTESENVSNFLSTFSTNSEKGYAYEMVCNILTKFGFIDYFNGVKHFEGNINLGFGKLKEITSLDYLVNGTMSYKKTKTGCSDITVKKEEKYYLCSVKFRDDNNVLLKDYDIGDIISVVETLKRDCDYEVVLFVNNKQIVEEKMRLAQSNQILVKKIGRVIGLEDIELGFNRFKKRIVESKEENYTEDFLLRKKEFFDLRFHQEMLVEKTMTLIKDHKKVDVLWGCKPRSGKTYMAAGLILKIVKADVLHGSLQGTECSVGIFDPLRPVKNVLITTNHPTEVRNEFIELFSRYEDFKSFNVVNIMTKEELTKILSIKKEDKKIVFCSKQLLQTFELSALKNKFCLTIYDENHDGGTTEISNNILKEVGGIVIYMTGTPLKTIRRWNIEEKARLMWTIEDEKMCKTVMQNVFATDYFIEKFGEEANTLINQYIKSSILEERFCYYEKMPTPAYLTVVFNKERYMQLLKETSDTVYGFSFKTLFCLTKDLKQFQYEDEVKLFLRYITGSQKHIDFKNGDESIFRRITTLLQKENSRDCKTQLWFLPPNNIDEISNCLKKLMEMDRILKTYNILIINSKRNISDVNLEIKNAEEKGKVIILAGSMLQLGVSIPNCDVVMMFHDSSNIDKFIQQSYRSMTESEGKKIGIIVDLNPGRILQMIQSTIEKSGIKNILEYNYKYNLINLDLDIFENDKIYSEDWIIEKLVNEWMSLPIHSYVNIMKRLDQEMEEIQSDTQELIYKCFNNITSNQTNIALTIMQKEKLPLNKGIKRELVSFDQDPDELEIIDVEKEIEKIVFLFKREILPYAIQLVTVLTIDQNMVDFLSMLKWIKRDNELIKCFNEQTNCIWHQKEIIDLIILISSKLELGIINDICLSIRLKINAMIDYPEELLKLLNDCLKPKLVEKKQNGEVFTPPSLVEEMLDKLPKEVWSNKDLTWFDPAVGMGNFMIFVYLRLMNGLDKVFPDKHKRKKHILEKMLYMSELNKKNCFLVKQIFDIKNEFKLNIHNGDTLNLKIYEIFKIKEFDIIIGNPPYNASGDVATGNTIWQHFVFYVLKILKKDGYLCFIHPPGWRKPNTEKGKFYGLFDIMTKENTLLYLEIHNTKDGMKTFSCGTRYDIYVLCKKKNDNYKTLITDENNIKYKINLKKYNWLANCYLELIDNLIANEEEKCKILYSRNNYGADKKWISKNKTKDYTYPVVHSTPKNGHRILWSNRNDNGFFGVKKVIFGDSGIYNPIIDIEGKYAMTQHAMAIEIETQEDGIKLARTLDSDKFKKILEACSWSSFAIEWGMFKSFKKDFFTLI